jgi:hypothetical protein
VLKFQEVQDASESSVKHDPTGLLSALCVSNSPLYRFCRNHVLHGVHVKDVMQQQIAPELHKVHKPQVFKYRQEIGVHAVIGIGNTSRHIFAGIATTLEQGCIKLLLPHVKHAQQSPSLAIPICFLEGEPLTRAANTHLSIYAEDRLACNGLMFLLLCGVLSTGLSASKQALLGCCLLKLSQGTRIFPSLETCPWIRLDWHSCITSFGITSTLAPHASWASEN